MSVDPKQISDVLDDRLTNLDDSLSAASDVKILEELKQAIGRLVDDDKNAEESIRRVLRDRLKQGQLREETYELVLSMLDRFLTEDVRTMPGDITYDSVRPPMLNETSNANPDDDQFSSTTVLPNDVVKTGNPDDRVQVGSVLRDRFLLQERVSGGSMGVVFKALDRRLAEAGAATPYVAIKVLSPQLAKSGSALRALQQEAAKGRFLTHPNIVRFIDLDRDDDLYFIVLEWLEGRTLAEILDSADGKNIDIEESLGIVRQIGKALEYAHRCGIVHADVKPGNIMILPNGDAKLFDFGVARVRQTQDAKENFDPAVLGAMTPAYSSMQVLTGDEPTPSDDVFSLGCLLYRLVAGYRVFGPRNAAEAAEAGMTPQRIENLSDAQWSTLRKSIAFARIARFATVAEFVNALNDPGSVSIELEADELNRLGAPPKSGNGMLWLLAFLTGLAIAAYFFGWIDKGRDWIDESGLLPEMTQPAPVAVPAIESAPVETPGSEVLNGEETPEAGEPELTEPENPDLDVPVNGLTDFEPSVPFQPELVTDFSVLPPADASVNLVPTQGDSAPIVVTLREDGGDATVDLLRSDSLDFPLRLRIEEVAYSGNRSPWAAGQYLMSEDSIIEIPAGQDRVRISFSMASDPLREADQQSTLRIRPADTTRTQLGAIEIILEDDDQRDFESRLPPNTIAFAVSQVSVRERDPAVQVDVLRFNPDDQPVVVGYLVRDITATEGEDYFAPSGHSIAFGPGQRSARLLIPLVQDSLVEGDEAFTVELAVQTDDAPSGVFQRIIVMIRDDDIAVE